ncbi:septation protein A [Iodobacter sp. LRB]|uniref:septation protein A n=1 Tax=unclassified Iodobacter TaxID=235634 RepID=UPI000C12235D|nr:septation protein A [Iodobacter sp. BJB302]PHV00642.1 septation protein A [Iodobacter sp. BJB302]
MKALFDLFSVILFFVTYSITKSIYAATGVAIATTTAQVAWSWFKHRKVDGMLWLSFGLITVLGGATLLLHNKMFILWKPTVLYWVFALILCGSRYIRGKNLMQSLMGPQMTLPAKLWDKVNLAWVLFFICMGVLNLYVAFNYSEDLWVKFKMFGTLVLTLVFVLLQALVLSRYLNDQAEDKKEPS